MIDYLYMGTENDDKEGNFVTEIEKIIEDIDYTDGAKIYYYTIKERLKNLSEDYVFYGSYELLKNLLGMNFVPNNQRDPYQPCYTNYQTKMRSIKPNDLSEDDLDLISDWYDKFTDPEIKAILGDILWLTRKDHTRGIEAIDHYLSIAKNQIKTGSISRAKNCFSRSIILGKLFSGKNTNKITPIKKEIDSIIEDLEKTNGNENKIYHLISVLYDSKLGNPKDYSKKCEKAANELRKNKKFHLEQLFWQLKGNWDDKIEDETDIPGNKGYLELAKSYENEANAVLRQDRKGKYLHAINLLSKVIESLRKVSDTKDEVERIRKRIQEIQPKSVENMGKIETSPNFDPLDQIINEFDNYYSFDFIFSLFSSKLFLPTQIEELNENIANEIGVLSQILPTQLMSEEGKIEESINSFDSDDESEHTKKQKYLRFKTESFRYIQKGYMINKILSRYYLRSNTPRDELRYLLTDNPIIPSNRVEMILKGIMKGFEQHFDEAMLILIPEFENIIRYLMYRKGVITTSWDDDGIQKSYDMNATLYSDELKSIFPEFLLISLQSLLIDQIGLNLRNKIAHGLETFSSGKLNYYVYIWWLICHIIFEGQILSIVSQFQKSNLNEEGQDNTTETDNAD